MPLALLPTSAQAFSPRSATIIVFNTRVETWLKHELKRITRVKHLKSVFQYHQCLTETLSGSSALWTLASITVPKAPDSELEKIPDDPLREAFFSYQLIQVEAYVVHVDMVSQNEITFKLTQDSIDALTEYHKDIYSVNVAASTWNWTDKDKHLEKLQDNFIQAVNRYVYRTHVRALEGLQDDGAGELLEGRSEEVKNVIMALFLPLIPPLPPIVEVLYGAEQTMVPPFKTCHVDLTPISTITPGDSVSSAWLSSGITKTCSHVQPNYITGHYCRPPQIVYPSVIAKQYNDSAAGIGYESSGWNGSHASAHYPIHT